MRYLCLVSVLTSCLVLASCADEERAPSAEPPQGDALRALLEDAASCPAGPLQKLVDLGGKLAMESEEDIGLTPVLVLLAGRGPADVAHVQWVGPPERATPEHLLAALAKGAPADGGDRISVLRRDFIVAMEARVSAGELEGTVKFRVPQAIRGHVDFRARKVDGAWRVVAFRLPLDGLRTTRQEDGRWQLAPLP